MRASRSWHKSYAGQRFYAGRFATPTVTVALYVIEYNDGLQPEGIVVAKGQVVVQLDIVESAIMDTGQVTAAEIATGLAKDGHIALYGILFDTNKAELKAESAAAVEQIAGVLKANASVKLYVVGHTGNVGAHEYNLELSRKRAESVVRELTAKHGIAADRLVPAGVGAYAPVASNGAEAGRAKNQRVELVQR